MRVHLGLMGWGRLALVAASLGLVALLVSCGGAGKGRPDPDFQVALFSGSSFQLSEQEGKNVVVLNFWFPSCPPCRAEMPDLEKVWHQVEGKGVRFLGLLVPQGLDTEQDARELVAALGLTYDFATDTRVQIALA